jgi:hypothetical protein
LKELLCKKEHGQKIEVRRVTRGASAHDQRAARARKRGM